MEGGKGKKAAAGGIPADAGGICLETEVPAAGKYKGIHLWQHSAYRGDRFLRGQPADAPHKKKQAEQNIIKA